MEEEQQRDDSNEPLIVGQLQGILTPLHPCEYITYPDIGRERVVAGDQGKGDGDSSSHPTTSLPNNPCPKGALSPCPSYQVPVFSFLSPNSVGLFRPLSPTNCSTIPINTATSPTNLQIFSWPNSMSSNGTQGSPAYFTNASFPQASPPPPPPAFLYTPLVALAPCPPTTPKTTTTEKEESQRRTRSRRGERCQSRKRKYESDTESIGSEDPQHYHHRHHDFNEDEDADAFCNCQDCIAYLLEDLYSSDDDTIGATRRSRSPSLYSNTSAGGASRRSGPCRECGRYEKRARKQRSNTQEKDEEERGYYRREHYYPPPNRRRLAKRSRSCSSLPRNGADYDDLNSYPQGFIESRRNKDCRRCDFHRHDDERPDEEMSEVEDEEDELILDDEDLEEQLTEDTRSSTSQPMSMSPPTTEKNNIGHFENSQPTTLALARPCNAMGEGSENETKPYQAVESVQTRAESSSRQGLVTSSSSTAIPLKTSSAPEVSPEKHVTDVPLTQSSGGSVSLQTLVEVQDDSLEEEGADVPIATLSDSKTGFVAAEEEEAEDGEMESEEEESLDAAAEEMDGEESLDVQILQVLRAALGIPDDVELEEYEPVDEDDETENAEDGEEEEEETGSRHVFTGGGLEEIKGCLALVEDVFLTYGKVASASPKVQASIEGDASRVVIGGFLVSTSHITRDSGRLGYSLGFYLDDLELNSFVLQVQDGLLQVGGTRDKSHIYLRIEIGAPVRIPDVSVNHNKATNVIWVEVFF